MKRASTSALPHNKSDHTPEAGNAVPLSGHPLAPGGTDPDWRNVPRPPLPPIPFHVRNHEPNLHEFEIY